MGKEIEREEEEEEKEVEERQRESIKHTLFLTTMLNN